MHRFSVNICRLILSLLLCFQVTLLYAVHPDPQEYGFGVCVPKYVSVPDPWNDRRIEVLIKNEPAHYRKKLVKHRANKDYQLRKTDTKNRLAALLKGIENPYISGQEPFKIKFDAKLAEQKRGKVDTKRPVNIRVKEIGEPLSEKLEKDEEELHRLFRIFREEGFGSSLEESSTCQGRSKSAPVKRSKSAPTSTSKRSFSLS